MEKVKKKKGILNGIEKVGNALPHPATIFILLCAGLVLLSAVLAKMGVNVTYTGVDSHTMEVKEMTANVISLLSPDGIRFMFESAVSNFTGFAPLGTVLVALLGVGVAEGTGLIGTLLRKLVTSTPKRLITVVVVFAGIISNIASDAGYVILIPLGAIVFLSFGRHPLAGLAAAFAGVSGGFSANIIFGPTDALLSGISQEAAASVVPGYEVGIASNWYFLIASTVLITIVGTIITEKIVEPRLGEYKGKKQIEKVEGISKEEKRGLLFSGVALLIFAIFMAILVVPEGSPLRNPETGEILKSPFMSSMVAIISLAFMIPGIAFGIGKGEIRNDKQVVSLMSKSMASMGGYIVLVFFAAQFVAYFNYTKIGTVVAVNGADFLKNIGLTGVPLIIAFIAVSAFINLFMGSASAKWAIMAPVFIPMFMDLGYTPELIQMAYRIGDSSTNIISPLMTYFALIVAFAEVYDEDTGIGTLISTMVPYSIGFLICWSILLVAWFLLGLPLGPGAGLFM
ncbi:MAG: AbgT family transporter [Clostridium sp.]|uniref:AbgT family transporter n=1 Tax=Clostridium chrysemydis TaxID=2665504 RepID=UPI003EE79653